MDEYEVIATGFNEDGDEATHDTSYGFCFDPNCPCHDDTHLAQGVLPDYQNGLVTAEEATNITQGRTF